MRVLATADLHFNHPKSRQLAIEQIDRINQMSFDVLLVIGDTGHSEGDEVEQCLRRFAFAGPKLFVAGNHELWTRTHDATELLTRVLPDRIRAVGWHWLEGAPLIVGDTAFVGSVGWYDYSFAADHLEIPVRFYQAKVSPGAAARLREHEHLVKDATDVTARHLDIVARWNDGRFARIGRTDEQFLHERLNALRHSLEQVKHARHIVAGIHHLPFRELLPPRRNSTWDFVWAYLGAQSLGDLMLEYPNVSHVLCGHSHLPGDHQISHIRVINVGSGYRQKRLVEFDV